MMCQLIAFQSSQELPINEGKDWFHTYFFLNSTQFRSTGTDNNLPLPSHSGTPLKGHHWSKDVLLIRGLDYAQASIILFLNEDRFSGPKGVRIRGIPW